MKLAAALVLTIGAGILAGGAGTQAPAPAAAPGPVRPVPVAASTLASTPDSFYGQVVSVTATLERSLSATAFIIAGRLKIEDRSAPAQDKTKSTGHELLVIAPTLTAGLDAGASVTVVGEAMRFDPAEIARREQDYKLDLGADVIAAYQGRPVIVAKAVVNAALVDLAFQPPPPLTPEEEAFDEVMKRVGPAFNDLRTAVTASSAAVAAESSKLLKDAFADAETFWKARNTADALAWTRTARTQLTAIERAAEAGKWDEVKTSFAEVNRMCSTCHTAYRERLEDGEFRVKSGSLAR